MAENPVVIEYSAILLGQDGHEGSLDLDEPGWKLRDDVLAAKIITFRPNPGHEELPIISVHVGPQPDGTVRELVYLSRMYGTIGMATDVQNNLFRAYCFGWKTTVGDKEVRSVCWVIPRGSVIMADEPPQEYVNDLIQHFTFREEN